MSETAAASPAPTSKATTTHIFVSYSRKDAEFAGWLRDRLEQAGLEVFRDVDDTLPGEEWWQRLRGLIGESDTIVFVLSPNSVASTVCRDEIEESRRLGKRIFPVVLAPVDWSIVPDGLARIHSVYFDDPEKRDASLATLLDALAIDIGWVREHTRLGGLAHRWQLKGKPAAALLRGQELTEAERWASARPAGAQAPTSVHLDLIAASRRAATRRQRLTVALSLGVAAVSIGLGIWAEVNRREAAFQEQIAQAEAAEADRQRAVAETERATAEEQRIRADAQRDRALKSQSQFMANAAEQQLAAEDTMGGKSLSVRNQQALLLALEAVQPTTDGIERPYVQSAENVLGTALLAPQPNGILFADGFANARYSPGGRAILVSTGETAFLYEADDLWQRRELRDGDARVLSAAFTHYGDHVLTASDDNRVALWKSADGMLVRSFDVGSEPVSYGALEGPDGAPAALFVRTADTLLGFIVATGEKFSENPAEGDAQYELLRSPEGTHTALLSSVDIGILDNMTGAQMALFQVPTVDIEWRPPAEGRTMEQLAVLSESGAVAIIGGDGSIIVQKDLAIPDDNGTPATIAEIGGQPTSLAFSPDGEDLIVTVRGSVIFRLRADDLTEMARLEAAKTYIHFEAARYDPLGEMVITTSYQLLGYHEGDGVARTVAFLDPDTLQPVVTLPISMAALGAGQIRRNGRQLIDDEGLVWSLDELRASFRRTRAIAGDSVVAIDESGTNVVLQKADHALRIVEVSGTAADIQIDTLTQADVAEARFSRDGDKLYLRTDAGVVETFDAKSGARIWGAPWQALPVAAFDLLPDGDLVTISQRGSIFRWRSGQEAAAAAYEAGSRLLGAGLDASSDDAVLLLRDGATGTMLRRMSLADGSVEWERKLDGTDGTTLVTADETSVVGGPMAFSPDGELIAVGAGTSVLVYDAAGKEVAWLRDHRCNVTEMRFLSATDLMTTSSDQPATVWHLPSGELASKIRTFAFGSLIDICWEPAHTQILPELGRVASFTHTAGITDWVPFLKDEAAMTQAAESLVARCLNTAERAEFFLDPEPPHWCITGPGRSDDPAQWRPYWPYGSPEWTEWLKARKSGESPPLPVDDTYLAEIPVAAS